MFGWDDAALLLGSAAANYFGSQQKTSAQPSLPSNYYGSNGAMQIWDPNRNGYITLDSRTTADDLASNYGNKLIQNKIMGVGNLDTAKAGIQSQIQALQAQYDPSYSSDANTEILSRIKDLTATMNNMKDVDLGYSPIGQSSATDLLRYQGGTDTVNKYLTDTLDTGYKEATDQNAQTMAKRGMASSTMNDWGQDEMARRYATDKTGVAVQSEDYYRQLKAADESAKQGILTAANSNLGLSASISAGQNSATQAQESLAQQLASYNNELQSNWQQQKTNVANANNQSIWSTLAGAAKMGTAGYYGGTTAALGFSPQYWGTGWNGKTYTNSGNPNSSYASSSNPNGTR